MEVPIPKWMEKLWNLWNLRGSIVLSLTIQMILMLFASFRQRCRTKLLLVFIWLAYLLADWIAAVAIGQITRTQADPCGPPKKHRADHQCDDRGIEQDFLALWASFLLLHLGGPDSITSFALEDNEFWLRHLLTLLLQVLGAAYSLYLTLPQNRLWLPTALIFVVGTYKFGERTAALYLASLDHFGETVLPKPNPGPDYEQTRDIYSSMRTVSVPISTAAARDNAKPSADHHNRPPADDFKLLEMAHHFFERFKGLIIGILLSSRERDSSRAFFLRVSADEAFRLVEYELNFIYDVLHTKIVVARNRIGYAVRFLSGCSVSAAFWLFHLAAKEHTFCYFEEGLTYSLLCGALAQDMVSVFKLIFSDWTLIVLNSSFRKCIPSKFVKRSRWCGLVRRYNIISYCLDERPICLYNLTGCLYCKGVLKKLKIWWCQSSKSVDAKLQLFIFNELRNKSLAATSLGDAVQACSQRGSWALLQNSNCYQKLKWSILEYQYAESLLIWHIATEIYYAKSSAESNSMSDEDNGSKEICKILSDYMFYIMVAQPAMVAPVLGNWNIAFQDTCAEANKYFKKFSRDDHLKACNNIYDIIEENPTRPAAVKGDESKSVLFDGCILAKELRELNTDPWQLMSRVWLELLSYAAINCRPIVHAQQPSKGGELLTFIWLLMNHLGLGTQFFEHQPKAGIKMVGVK